MDGRHSRIRFDKGNAGSAQYVNRADGAVLVKKDYYSFKLKKSALNTQMCVGADDYIEWVSDDSLPAGRWNDITHLKANLESFKKIFEDDDVCCFDGGYQSIGVHVPACLPHRKPQGLPLTWEEELENASIAEFRGKYIRNYEAS